MGHKAKMLVTFFSFSALMSTSCFAHLPLSYNDVLQYERERMANKFKDEDGSHKMKQPVDEKWLTNTPVTWGYLINAERLRMKQTQPISEKFDSSQPARDAGVNTMPTTWNDSLQQQHQQMKHNQE